MFGKYIRDACFIYNVLQSSMQLIHTHAQMCNVLQALKLPSGIVASSSHETFPLMQKRKLAALV